MKEGFAWSKAELGKQSVCLLVTEAVTLLVTEAVTAAVTGAEAQYGILVSIRRSEEGRGVEVPGEAYEAAQIGGIGSKT